MFPSAQPSFLSWLSPEPFAYDDGKRRTPCPSRPHSAIRPNCSGKFLGFFQKPYLRFLHAIIAVLVILQILSSFAMHMLSSGQLNPALSSWLASWYHILSGLLVVILSLLLAADSLTKRGFH